MEFDASSRILEQTESYNIWGTIPGREEDMILLSAHYDSYYDGFQDDNCAVAMMLGIARALLETGYRPRKTLVFCAMAAEEWGIVNSKYDLDPREPGAGLQAGGLTGRGRSLRI